MAVCFFCQKTFELNLNPGEKVPFREECPHCGMDVHICANCSFYDPGHSNACREPQAERVLDPEARNVCEYYQLSGGDGVRDDEAARAKAQLENLFKK